MIIYAWMHISCLNATRIGLLAFFPLAERPLALKRARSLSTVKLWKSLLDDWPLDPSACLKAMARQDKMKNTDIYCTIQAVKTCPAIPWLGYTASCQILTYHNHLIKFKKQLNLLNLHHSSVFLNLFIFLWEGRGVWVVLIL